MRASSTVGSIVCDDKAFPGMLIALINSDRETFWLDFEGKIMGARVFMNAGSFRCHTCGRISGGFGLFCGGYIIREKHFLDGHGLMSRSGISWMFFVCLT